MRMKIAVIGAKGLPASQGGIEHYCEELYPKVVAEGHIVHLFARASYTQMGWFSSYTHRGVKIICLPSVPFGGLDAFSNAFLATVFVLIKRYDVIHFHALGPALFSCLPRALSRAGVMVVCHGLDWQRAKWGRWSRQVIRAGERVAVHSAHELVVVSEELQAYFQRTYNLKATYIPTAPATYQDSDDDFPFVRQLGLVPKRYVLFLGRLVPEKRPDLLIHAFQALEHQGWKLALVGGVSATSQYVAELQRMIYQPRDVILTDELRGQRLSEVVRGAGLFVLPSDVEGLPLSMLEVMREGVPVVASDIPAHYQLIGEDRGLLFEAGSLLDCQTCLEWALRNPQAVAAMARRAQEHVRSHYSWERVTYDNLALYAKIAGSARLRQYRAKAARLSNSAGDSQGLKL